MLIAVQAVGGVICIAAYSATGLHLVWTAMPIALPLIAIALAVWWATRADAALAVALLLSCSALILLLQYPALALGRPMVDDALLRADALAGVSVPTSPLGPSPTRRSSAACVARTTSSASSSWWRSPSSRPGRTARRSGNS